MSHTSNLPVHGDGIVKADTIDAAMMLCNDGLSNPLEMAIACNKLPNLDVGSKTDPFAVVYLSEKE